MFNSKKFDRYAIIVILGCVLALFLIPNLVYADVENIPPQATAFSLEPKVVNTSIESQEITVSLALKDDFAGVGFVALYLAPESGTTQRLSLYPRRVSGDSLKGTYTATAKLPVGSKDGVWSVILISFR